MAAYTNEEIYVTPDNHVYARIVPTAEELDAIAVVANHYDGLAVNPGLHLTRAFHCVLYRSNVNIAVTAAMEIGNN